MMIAQVTIIGMLGLKRASYSSFAMIFLLIATMLFTYFIKQEHFKLAMILSAKECVNADISNLDASVDWSIFRGQYVQPELRERQVAPENSIPDGNLSRGIYRFRSAADVLISPDGDKRHEED
jgi:hypothetical protein